MASFEDPERAREIDPERIVDALPLRPDMVVADIGAGSGYFTRRIAKRVPQGKVVAVDIDLVFKQYIEAHREEWGTPNIEPHLALDYHPALPVGSLDLVFLSNTYAYIGDRSRYLRNVGKALDAEGWLVIIDYRTDARCGPPRCPRRGQRVAKSTALAELSQAGFTLDHEETFLPHQYFLLLRKQSGEVAPK